LEVVESIKWGVIGAGGIADRRTIPEGILPAENSKLIAVMDAIPEVTKRIAQKYRAKRAYFKEEDLVRDPEVDAVYIATPVYLHAKQAILAAEAGKHILCEKPLALSISGCEDIMAACRRNNVKLMVGFMMRFHTCHEKAREMIEKGMIGQLVMGRAQLTCWYPKIPGAWRQDPKLGGGGALMDMGIHCVDLLRMFIGEVDEVSAFANTIVHEYPVEDTSTMIMRFRNGAHGIVDNYFNIPDAAAQNVLEIYGTNGCILAKGTIGQSSTGKITAYVTESAREYEAAQTRETTVQKEEFSPPPRNIYRAEIEHFARCIEEDTEPFISGTEAARDLRVVLAAYESARTKRVVRLS